MVEVLVKLVLFIHSFVYLVKNIFTVFFCFLERLFTLLGDYDMVSKGFRKTFILNSFMTEAAII